MKMGRTLVEVSWNPNTTKFHKFLLKKKKINLGSHKNRNGASEMPRHTGPGTEAAGSVRQKPKTNKTKCHPKGENDRLQTIMGMKFSRPLEDCSFVELRFTFANLQQF